MKKISAGFPGGARCHPTTRNSFGHQLSDHNLDFSVFAKSTGAFYQLRGLPVIHFTRRNHKPEFGWKSSDCYEETDS
jgi:hypothetical protein